MNERTSKKRIRGPNTKEYIKDDILLLKKNDRDGKLSAKAIRERLIKMHPGSKYIPKERAISNIIQKNKEKVQFNPIDSPWSIGSCEKYSIPTEIIPTLIEFEQLGQPKFTIRQARWFARLKPIVYEMSAEKHPLEDALSGMTATTGKITGRIPAPHNDPRLVLLAIITYQYAAREQHSELKGKQYLDTSDLDFTIFAEGKIGPGEAGKPIIVHENDWDPVLAFNSRFQTNTMIISLKEKKK